VEEVLWFSYNSTREKASEGKLLEFRRKAFYWLTLKAGVRFQRVTPS
jgi:hypothetical protein